MYTKAANLEAAEGGAVATLGVVDEQVLGVAGDARDGVLESVLGDVLAQAAGLLAEAEEVGADAGDVGRRHRGAADLVGLAAGPGGGDVRAGREDVDDAAEVGVGGQGVVDGSGANSAGGRLGGGGVAGGVGAVIAGGDGEEEAGLDDLGGGGVHGIGLATTQRHVDDNTLGARLAGAVLGDELHTGNDTGVLARAVSVEDLDTEDLGLLGDTIGLGADGAGDVGAVAVAVGVVLVDVVGQELGTALELLRRC